MADEATQEQVMAQDAHDAPDVAEVEEVEYE